MSSQDLHQVILRWPYTDANEVIVTGTFDKWSSSLRLTRKPDGFETPIFMPWKDKIAYKFIVDGRWMTNNTEPTEIDHGYVNNVYTAPPKPPPQELKPIPPQPSYPPESQVEPDHAEKLPEEHVANGYALDEPHDVAIATSAAEPEPEKSSTLVEEVKAVVTPVVEGAQAAVAQLTPDPQEVEKAADEIAPEIQPPKEPITTALSPAQSSPEQEHPTHVADGSAPAVVAPVEAQDSVLAQVDGPAEVAAAPVEKGVSSPASEADPPKEDERVKAPVEPEPASASAAAEPETVPVTEREAPASDAPTTIPEQSEPVASPAPVPAVEQKSPPTESHPPIPATAASGPEDVKSSDAAVPTAPAVNGHTKSTSTESTSTAVPTLPTTPARKASRKFSFPGRDKSGNSSPTGSSRFSSQQKREKRQSLLGKLKEIFGDKEKKEKGTKA